MCLYHMPIMYPLQIWLKQIIYMCYGRGDVHHYTTYVAKFPSRSSSRGLNTKGFPQNSLPIYFDHDIPDCLRHNNNHLNNQSPWRSLTVHSMHVRVQGSLASSRKVWTYPSASVSQSLHGKCIQIPSLTLFTQISLRNQPGELASHCIITFCTCASLRQLTCHKGITSSNSAEEKPLLNIS